MLMFNYDEAKSQSNQVKHGIDFIVAQQLWKDPDLLEIPAKTQDEPRYLVIGRIAEKHWSAIIGKSTYALFPCAGPVRRR